MNIITNAEKLHIEDEYTLFLCFISCICWQCHLFVRLFSISLNKKEIKKNNP